MIIVYVKEGEPVEKALRRFKKKLDKTRVLKDLRERRYYIKTSRKRRDKKLKAIYKQQLRARASQ
ncbi:MAG: 30S ribosomal protein S21 [Bacteroidota bacterium]